MLNYSVAELRIERKNVFFFALSSLIRTFDFVEGRLHLNNKNKKNNFLFCIVFDLHYLCTRIGCRNGGIGRHEGLKIPWPVMAVWVRVPLAAPF